MTPAASAARLARRLDGRRFWAILVTTTLDERTVNDRG